MNRLLIAILALVPVTVYAQGSDAFANLNGLDIHYTVKGSGPPMIVGHPTSGKIGYEMSLKPLEKHFTIIYYDSRGTGKSQQPQTDQEYDDAFLVDEISALIDHLNLGQAWLFGHSDQSAIALEFALKYPSQTMGLILTGTGLVESWDKMLETRRDSERRRIKQSRWFAQVVRDWDTMISTGKNTDEQGRDLTDAPLKWWCYDENSAKKVLPMSRAVSAAGRRKTKNNNAQEARRQIENYVSKEKQFAKIDHKILIINGRYDTNNPEEKVTKLHNILSGSKLVILERSGHFPWIEQPDEFFGNLAEWLATL